MVEISYDEYSEQVDLAGKSVAEVREQYKSEFSIPDKAKARLNDKEVKKKLEPRTMLDEGDELCFQDKQRSKMPFFITAVMLALAVTGGVFAYGYTTAGVTLGVIAAPDWAEVAVSSGATAVTWDVFGRYIGTLPTDQKLFDVTPSDNWTGDWEVRVYLTNTDEMVRGYRYINMKLMFVDPNSINTPVDEQGTDPAHKDYQILNLRNAEVIFLCQDLTGGTTYNVVLDGGSYMSHPGAWISTGVVRPELWAEVTQAGLHSGAP